MKKIILLAAALCLSCASFNSEAEPVSSVEKECIELTEEVKAERATHEKHLNALSEYMEIEVKQLSRFMLKETGSATDIKVHDRNFVNNYAVAIVYASAHQHGEHVADLYFVIASHEDGSFETIGLLARKPLEVERAERELKKILEEELQNLKQLRKGNNEYKL